MKDLKIVITDYITSPATIEQQAFPQAQYLFADSKIELHKQTKLLADADGLMVWHAAVDSRVVAGLKKCKHVVRYGVGYENIDLLALERAGILFSNTPDYGIDEVADTACAFILNFNRGINYYNHVAKSLPRNWQENTLSSLTRQSELSLGIIGMGRIGVAVLRRMKAFGMKVYGYDPYRSVTHARENGYEKCNSLESLLKVSDIVSLHCPQTKDTRGMVNDSFLSLMKDQSILINTARGGLVDNLSSVLKAIESGKLSNVGFDVLPEEPPLSSNPLISKWVNSSSSLQGRLIINPHTAFYSKQSWRDMRFKAAETLKVSFEIGEHRNAIVPLESQSTCNY